MSTESPDPAPDFEESMADLEDCVTRLESGELSLEESLQVFERGIAALPVGIGVRGFHTREETALLPEILQAAEVCEQVITGA